MQLQYCRWYIRTRLLPTLGSRQSKMSWNRSNDSNAHRCCAKSPKTTAHTTRHDAEQMEHDVHNRQQKRIYRSAIITVIYLSSRACRALCCTMQWLSASIEKSELKIPNKCHFECSSCSICIHDAHLAACTVPFASSIPRFGACRCVSVCCL